MCYSCAFHTECSFGIFLPLNGFHAHTAFESSTLSLFYCVSFVLFLLCTYYFEDIVVQITCRDYTIKYFSPLVIIFGSVHFTNRWCGLGVRQLVQAADCSMIIAYVLWIWLNLTLQPLGIRIFWLHAPGLSHISIILLVCTECKFLCLTFPQKTKAATATSPQSFHIFLSWIGYTFSKLICVTTVFP